MTNCANKLIEFRPAYISNERWEEMKEASPVDLAMMSIVWETDEGYPTLWRVLLKHPEVINQVAPYNNRTLLMQAMLNCRSACMWRLVEFGAQFGPEEASIAQCWDASRAAYEKKAEIREEARQSARRTIERENGKYIYIPVPEDKIHPLLK